VQYSHSQTPDRRIVKKLKNYDRNLYIRWNATQEWFELWEKRPWGPGVLVTTVTRNLFEPAPMEYCDLDERLLWWVYWADTHRHGGRKGLLANFDKRMGEMFAYFDRDTRQTHRDIAKDIWSAHAGFYLAPNVKKNSKPKFNNFKPQRWVMPDVQSRNSQRIFYRSKNNALRFNWKGRR